MKKRRPKYLLYSLIMINLSSNSPEQATHHVTDKLTLHFATRCVLPVSRFSKITKRRERGGPVVGPAGGRLLWFHQWRLAWLQLLFASGGRKRREEAFCQCSQVLVLQVWVPSFTAWLWESLLRRKLLDSGPHQKPMIFFEMHSEAYQWSSSCKSQYHCDYCSKPTIKITLRLVHVTI